MIIVSRLLLRFFSLRHHFIFLSFVPLYPSLQTFKLQIHHWSDVEARLATSVHLHRVIILGKRIGGSLYSLRIGQLRTRCEVGGE